MNKVKTIRVYNLVDANGNKLILELGVTDVKRDDKPWDSADKGYRWRFIGKHIPMPVRSMYWFNGFAEPVMLDWLKGNGWYPRARVEMCSGYAHVYELPGAEPIKGNEETPHVYEVPGYVTVAGENAFKDAIRYLCNNVNKMTAICMYRYVHPCSLEDANLAVNAIQFDGQQ